jgi:hypothetical protein
VSSWADVSLDLANANITIDLLWGGEVTCTFENRAPGHITIVKEVEWMSPAADWEFSSDMGDFTIPAAGGQQDFPNLLSQEDYTITETLKDGYDTMVVCNTGESGTDSVTVSLDPAEEVVCTFTNRTPPIGVVVDELGNRKEEFSVTDDVYAFGVGFEPNSQVDVYIVKDAKWNDGDPIPPDVSGDGMNTVPVDAAGHLGPVLVWPAPLTPGEYDMVFDANQNGTFDFWFDAVDDPNHPGFIVLARIPVGGTTKPVSNLTLLAPWLGLAALVMVGAAILVWRRGTRTA